MLIGVRTSSIRSGPPWLWSGPLQAPLRAHDLPAKVMTKIDARRAGVPDESWADGPGPRHYRLATRLQPVTKHPLWWLSGAIASTAGALVITSSAVRAALIAVAACFLILTVIALLAVSVDITDPHRLTARDRQTIADATAARTLHWTPLATAETVSDGAGYVLYAWELLEQAKAHPVLTDPMFQAALGHAGAPLDPDEELLLFARAGEHLDRLEWTLNATKNMWPEVAARTATLHEHELLEATLRRRVTALRRYVNELDAAGDRVSEYHRRAVLSQSDSGSAGYALIAEDDLREHEIGEACDSVIAASRAVLDVSAR